MGIDRMGKDFPFTWAIRLSNTGYSSEMEGEAQSFHAGFVESDFK